MMRKLRLVLFTSAIFLAAIACNILQTPSEAPANTATPTLTHEPGPPVMPTDSPTPAPTATDAPTPTTPPAVREGPFRQVTTLEDVLPEGESDLRLQAPADGSAWVLTGQLALRWDRQMWEFVLSESEEVLSAVDDSGRLWVLSQDMSEIKAWQDGQWTTYGSESGWTKATLNRIGLWWAPTPWGAYSGVGETVWLPASQDLRSFDGEKWTVHSMEAMGFPTMQETEDTGIIHTLAVGEDGKVFAGECVYSPPGPNGGGGLRWFDGETWHEPNPKFTSHCVSVVEVDKDGKFWLGAPDMIWQYDPADEALGSYSLPEELLGDYNFAFPRQLIVDGAGDIWVMMEMCGGASCSGLASLYRIQAGEWSLAMASEDWNLPPKQLALDGSGQGWLFWDGSVYRLAGEVLEAVAQLAARDVTVSPDGRVWAAADNEEGPALWVLEEESSE